MRLIAIKKRRLLNVAGFAILLLFPMEWILGQLNLQTPLAMFSGVHVFFVCLVLHLQVPQKCYHLMTWVQMRILFFKRCERDQILSSIGSNHLWVRA